MRRPTLYHYGPKKCTFSGFCTKSDFYRPGFPSRWGQNSKNPIFEAFGNPRKNRSKLLAGESAKTPSLAETPRREAKVIASLAL